MSSAFGFVINQRNEILLVQRAYGRKKGKWSMPGGNLDPRKKDKSLKDAAVRETKEETGIKMSADALYYKNRNGSVEVWRGRYKGGRLKPQRRECLDAGWFQMDMLPHDDNLAFRSDKKVIGELAARNSNSRLVHYPRTKMGKEGLVLVVNDRREILLVWQNYGRRKGTLRLPGSRPNRGQSRMDAAIFGAYKKTGVRVAIEGPYYESRHGVRVYLGKPKSDTPCSNSKWFPLDGLPDYENLAYAIDVKTIERWARDNNVPRP